MESSGRASSCKGHGALLEFQHAVCPQSVRVDYEMCLVQRINRLVAVDEVPERVALSLWCGDPLCTMTGSSRDTVSGIVTFISRHGFASIRTRVDAPLFIGTMSMSFMFVQNIGQSLFAVRKLVGLPSAVLPVICPVCNGSGILPGLVPSFFGIVPSNQAHLEDRKCTHAHCLVFGRVS